MFDHIPHRGFKTLRANDASRPLRAFFDDHREAIENAHTCSAGCGREAASDFAEELSCGDAISRRCRRRLDDLLDLFALEHVGYPDREEAGFFATIDPASPA